MLIIFGDGQIAQLPNHIPKDKTVLMCYGSDSIKENIIYMQISTALKDYNVMEFGGIESSPDYDTLMKAVAVVKANEPETFFILAVGGGSICDGCKFIALASMYNGSDPYGDLLEKQEEEIRSAVPLGVMMTLPATGSESNSNCVVTFHRTETKFSIDHPLLLPRFAILDPSLSIPLPYGEMAIEVMETFVRVCEQYAKEWKHMDRCTESLLKVLTTNEQLEQTRTATKDAREDIMWVTNHVLNHLTAQSVRSD